MVVTHASAAVAVAEMVIAAVGPHSWVDCPEFLVQARICCLATQPSLALFGRPLRVTGDCVMQLVFVEV